MNQRKPSFHTTTYRAAEEPRAKQRLCKAEIKCKKLRVDGAEQKQRAERERGKEPKSSHSGGETPVWGQSLKSGEEQILGSDVWTCIDAVFIRNHVQ